MATNNLENISIADMVKKVNAAKRYINRYADTSKPKQLRKLREYREFLKLIELQ